MRKQVRVLYHGQVQGVGFRATTVLIARRFDVTGQVRNEPDGSVSMEAEGEEAELDRFLAAIDASRLGSLISDRRLAWGTASGRAQSFTIQYW